MVADADGEWITRMGSPHRAPASPSRVCSRVNVNESRGMLVTNGPISQPSPRGSASEVVIIRNMDADRQIPADWLADFEAAARRPLPLRMRYAFIHTYKPVLDDARFRAFETMKDYREWCERNLPSWLGYGRV